MRFSVILTFATVSIAYGFGASARPMAYHTPSDAVASNDQDWHAPAKLNSRGYEYSNPLVARGVLDQWPASHPEVQAKAYDDEVHRFLKRYFGIVQRQPRLMVNENGDLTLPKQTRKKSSGITKVKDKVGGLVEGLRPGTQSQSGVKPASPPSRKGPTSTSVNRV
ncbi:hypothetical protein K474DRAFT_1772214 [Panus rudis PR-1116 ss-1]|nr:hypothetical protein K474DRAFT_1772214 [Panus rudis PR-1116 ss-1]